MVFQTYQIFWGNSPNVSSMTVMSSNQCASNFNIDTILL